MLSLLLRLFHDNPIIHSDVTHTGKIQHGAPSLPDRARTFPLHPPSIPNVASDPALQPSPKSSLIRRVTSKLHISIPLRSDPDVLRSARARPSRIPLSPTLPNGFGSKEHREAALRERGLLPPRKDLSQQEREADERISPTPSPVRLTFAGSTEAEQLKSNWLASNSESESGDWDCGPPPSLQGAEPGPQSMSSDAPDADGNGLRQSGDLPSAGRGSISSSLPPLLTAYLEVLHEDPSEQAPITPPPLLSPLRPPIIVSGPLDDPSSPIVVESPVSCTFSSHCPGSTLESQSQSDHFSVPVRESENARSRAPRRRTSDSCERPLKSVGMSLSRLGTRSLSNLHLRRRSVTEFSLGRASTSTSSSADLPLQVPRTAISPTMHSLGSIIRETRHIEDAESRRLSELAFLD